MKRDDPHEFGFQGPRYYYRRTRIRQEAADALDEAAAKLGAAKSQIDATALEFAAAVFLRHHGPGETFIACLRRRFEKID